VTNPLAFTTAVLITAEKSLIVQALGKKTAGGEKIEADFIKNKIKLPLRQIDVWLFVVAPPSLG